MNVYDSYWGPCEVADQIMKNFLDAETNEAKTDIISVERSVVEQSELNEQIAKHKYASMPKYFILCVYKIYNFREEASFRILRV
jgi:hypothetical protein